MVLTGENTPVLRRIQEFFLALWAILYLFFATIFGDPNKMRQ